MDLMRLFKLRPKANSGEALQASLQEVRAAREELAGRISALQLDRGQRLIDSDEAELQRTERELAEARSEAERLDAMMSVLEQRLQAVQRGERIEAVRAQIEEANAAAGAFVRWAREEYPKLLAAITAGLDLEVKAEAVLSAAHTQAQSLRGDKAAGLPAVSERPVHVLFPRSTDAAFHGAFGAMVVLPTLDGRAVPRPITREPPRYIGLTKDEKEARNRMYATGKFR